MSLDAKRLRFGCFWLPKPLNRKFLTSWDMAAGCLQLSIRCFEPQNIKFKCWLFKTSNSNVLTSWDQLSGWLDAQRIDLGCAPLWTVENSKTCKSKFLTPGKKSSFQACACRNGRSILLTRSVPHRRLVRQVGQSVLNGRFILSVR